MTATDELDELRRLLDERGVKHEGERSVRWRDRNGVIMQAFPLASGELGLEVWSCTPEQAIAATLDDTDATAMRQDYADLVAENAKLRELVKCLVRCGKGLSCDECTFGDVRDVTVCGVLTYAARLGIEVDGC